jgi:S-DNA-T family DNA segregation ATPase FtsK/SpoIIIE
VTSKIDSRTILGEQGAELLLGNGDMLFMSSASRIIRIHGPYVSEKEIERVSTFLRLQGSPTYIEEVTRIEDQENDEVVLNSEGKDELYNKAVTDLKLIPTSRATIAAVRAFLVKFVESMKPV